MTKKTAVKRARSESVKEEPLLALPHSASKAEASFPNAKKNDKKLKKISKKSAKKSSTQKPPLENESSSTLKEQKVGSDGASSSSSSDTPVALPPPPPQEMMLPEFHAKRSTTDKVMTNRQKCLVLGGRNMTSKARHLLIDLRGLMPHAREHSKMGGGAQHHSVGTDLVEVCKLHQCNSFLYLEPHRSDVTYMWLGQSPAGPSIKMQLTNICTADEIRMAGNCLKYSRPLLHFDRAFETLPHLRIVKSLLHMAFNTPRYHPKSKPFIDHIMSFFWLDDHIWVRNYQIVYPSGNAASNAKTNASSSSSIPLPASTVKKNDASLLEIGPRFTLEPVAIMNGCCQGNVLWKSTTARPPTEQRRDRKMRRLEKMEMNSKVQLSSEEHRARFPAPQDDPLDMVFQ